jgi:hypothetical protein
VNLKVALYKGTGDMDNAANFTCEVSRSSATPGKKDKSNFAK